MFVLRLGQVGAKYSEQDWHTIISQCVLKFSWKAFLHFTAIARSLELLGNDYFLIILILVHFQFIAKHVILSNIEKINLILAIHLEDRSLISDLRGKQAKL